MIYKNNNKITKIIKDSKEIIKIYKNNMVVYESVPPIVELPLIMKIMYYDKIFMLPLKGNVNIRKVDWGDGTIEENIIIDSPTHTYAESEKTYTVKIYGIKCDKWNGSVSPDRQWTSFLQEIVSWGNIPFQCTNMTYAFRNCSRLTSVADDTYGILSNVITWDGGFEYCNSLCYIGKLNTSNCTNLGNTFNNFGNSLNTNSSIDIKEIDFISQKNPVYILTSYDAKLNISIKNFGGKQVNNPNLVIGSLAHCNIDIDNVINVLNNVHEGKSNGLVNIASYFPKSNPRVDELNTAIASVKAIKYKVDGINIYDDDPIPTYDGFTQLTKSTAKNIPIKSIRIKNVKYMANNISNRELYFSLKKNEIGSNIYVDILQNSLKNYDMTTNISSQTLIEPNIYEYTFQQNVYISRIGINFNVNFLSYKLGVEEPIEDIPSYEGFTMLTPTTAKDIAIDRVRILNKCNGSSQPIMLDDIPNSTDQYSSYRIDICNNEIRDYSSNKKISACTVIDAEKGIYEYEFNKIVYVSYIPTDNQCSQISYHISNFNNDPIGEYEGFTKMSTATPKDVPMKKFRVKMGNNGASSNFFCVFSKTPNSSDCSITNYSICIAQDRIYGTTTTVGTTIKSKLLIDADQKIYEFEFVDTLYWCGGEVNAPLEYISYANI